MQTLETGSTHPPVQGTRTSNTLEKEKLEFEAFQTYLRRKEEKRASKGEGGERMYEQITVTDMPNEEIEGFGEKEEKQ